MTSRERVLKAISFQEPDRLPVDLGGTTGASGIHVLACRRLRKALGLDPKVKCGDVMQMLAIVEEDLRSKLGLDVVQISPLSVNEAWESVPVFDEMGSSLLLPAGLDLKKGASGWSLKGRSGASFSMPESSFYFDADDGKGWYSHPYEMNDAFLSKLSAKVESLYEGTGYALALNFGGNFGSSDPEFLMDVIAEPDKVAESLSKKCDDLIKRYSALYDAVGSRCFCVVFADDFGSQAAPMIGPELFREAIAPHYKRFTDWLHSKTSWKLFLHSCGAVEPLIEDFIAMGVDILNPIQTSANGMDPVVLKRKYGGRVVFWGGGCDTQRVLGFKSPEEVEAHVKERISILAPGGGFVFNQVHAIQPTVGADSILAMFDVVRKYGCYAGELVNA